MGLFEEFGANKSLQKDGKWVEFDGYKVLVAYAGEGNKKYERILELSCEPYQKKLARTKKPSPALRKKVHEAIVSTYSQSIVLGWEGIKRGTEVIEFSPKVCNAILLELPEFFSEIHSFANDLSNFQDDVDVDDDDLDESDEGPVEGAEKNS